MKPSEFKIAISAESYDEKLQNFFFRKLLYFLRNKPSKSVTVGLGRVRSCRFTILNDSASPKTDNRNFVALLTRNYCQSISENVSIHRDTED